MNGKFVLFAILHGLNTKIYGMVHGKVIPMMCGSVFYLVGHCAKAKKDNIDSTIVKYNFFIIIKFSLLQKYNNICVIHLF